MGTTFTSYAPATAPHFGDKALKTPGSGQAAWSPNFLTSPQMPPDIAALSGGSGNTGYISLGGITSAGSGLPSTSPNQVIAGPASGTTPATAAPRALVAADIPATLNPTGIGALVAGWDLDVNAAAPNGGVAHVHGFLRADGGLIGINTGGPCLLANQATAGEDYLDLQLNGVSQWAIYDGGAGSVGFWSNVATSHKEILVLSIVGVGIGAYPSGSYDLDVTASAPNGGTGHFAGNLNVDGIINAARTLSISDTSSGIWNSIQSGANDCTIIQSYWGIRLYGNSQNAEQASIPANIDDPSVSIFPPASGTGPSLLVNGTSSFSGPTTAPTPTAGDNSTNVATTAWVRNIGGAVSIDASGGKATTALTIKQDDLGVDLRFVDPIDSNDWTIDRSANWLEFRYAGTAVVGISSSELSVPTQVSSPTFVGDTGIFSSTLTAPTPLLGDNSTNVATTAFVQAAVAGSGVTFAGDLSGSSTTQTVVGLQGSLIDGGPVNGDLLRYTSATGKWEPTFPGEVHTPLANVVIPDGSQLGPADLFDLSGLVSAGVSTGFCDIQGASGLSLLSVLGQDVATPASVQQVVQPTQPNFVLAGPASGNTNALPTMRYLVPLDLPYYQLVKFVVLSGGTTYTPTTGVTALYVECVGGGGAGGGVPTTSSTAGAGGGGGSGAYSASWLTGSQVKASYTIAIGARGVGVSGGNGGNGGDTTFDSPSVCTAKGGVGSTVGTSSTLAATHGGAGGLSTSGVGDLKADGTAGGFGIVLSATIAIAGNGGGSTLAGGAQGASAQGGGNVANGYGGGGGGGCSINGAAVAGGNGGAGLIRVWEFA